MKAREIMWIIALMFLALTISGMVNRVGIWSVGPMDPPMALVTGFFGTIGVNLALWNLREQWIAQRAES